MLTEHNLIDAHRCCEWLVSACDEALDVPTFSWVTRPKADAEVVGQYVRESTICQNTVWELNATFR